MTSEPCESAPEASGENRATPPIPHWPGRLVSLGDHQVYVRSAPSEKTPAQEIAEPALCVHGLEGSSRNWTDLMNRLRSRLACDALDLPGFGDSPPRPDGRYSIAALAQTVIALIERPPQRPREPPQRPREPPQRPREPQERPREPQQRRGPVHLIGNSLGGAVCVKVAATRPELVRTLTLISPALPDSRPRMDLLRFPVMSLPRVGARLIRQYQALPPERRVADVITNCYSDPRLFARDRFAVEVAELTRRDTMDHAAAALVGSLRTLTAEFLRKGRHAAWRDAARITAASLVIYGSHDRLVDPRMAGRAAHQFKNARIVVLPRTGHVAHMEHPGVVAAEIGILLAAAGQGADDAANEGANEGTDEGTNAGQAREFPLASAG